MKQKKSPVIVPEPIVKEEVLRPPKFKFTKHTIPVILWNLFPVVGVLFFHWKPESVFICYALETIAAGGFNILAMLTINYFGLPPAEKKSGGVTLLMVSFFIVHYYLIVFIMLYLFFEYSFVYDSVFQALPAIIVQRSYAIALAAFVANSFYYFINGFVLNGEYTRTSMGKQMFAPYQRLLLIQPVVMIGSFISFLLGNSYPVLFIFVAVKIFLEVFPTEIKINGYSYRNYTEVKQNT